MTSLLYNDDCLNVLRGMPDCSVDAVISDLLYGMSYHSNWSEAAAARFGKPIDNDDVKPDLYREWMFRIEKVLKPGAPAFFFSRWDFAEWQRECMEDVGFVVKSQVIWDRMHHGMGDLRASFAPCHDTCWFCVKDGGRFAFPNGRPKSILSFQRVGGATLLHPTEKPIALMEHLVEKLTVQGETVLDPFMGSGTTGVACKNLGRNFIGIELDPTYFQIAQKRINPTEEVATW